MSVFNRESEEAFWSKVDIADDADCWPWLGAKNPKGYGNLRINKKYTRAHRVAWQLSNFEIPDGYVVCHVCDNPSCCNPHHLMLGTIKSNYIDMIKKNRQGFHKNRALGERNANAKLDAQKVIEMRNLYDGGVLDQYQLAEKYGVTQTTVGCVVRRDTWKHIGENNVR